MVHWEQSVTVAFFWQKNFGLLENFIFSSRENCLLIPPMQYFTTEVKDLETQQPRLYSDPNKDFCWGGLAPSIDAPPFSRNQESWSKQERTSLVFSQICVIARAKVEVCLLLPQSVARVFIVPCLDCFGIATVSGLSVIVPWTAFLTQGQGGNPPFCKKIKGTFKRIK